MKIKKCHSNKLVSRSRRFLCCCCCCCFLFVVFCCFFLTIVCIPVQRMICKDKEKMNIIDHLHADVNAKEEKIKSLKSIIESHCQLNKSLNDKVEELIDQLRQIQTQKELVRLLCCGAQTSQLVGWII